MVRNDNTFVASPSPWLVAGRGTWGFPQHVVLAQAHGRPAHELRSRLRDLRGTRHGGDEVTGLPGSTKGYQQVLVTSDGWW